MTARTLLIALACATNAVAQQPAAPVAKPASPGALLLSRDEIGSLARAQVAITAVHDSINAQLAKPANKKAESQQALKDKQRGQIEEILHHNGLTDAEYGRRTFMVSSDTATRRVFDSVVVVLTGAPLPGQIAAVAKVPVPPGPAGVHIGHIVNGYGDTPALMGLLPTAMAEARIAAQHATLASRQPTNLDYMKTHAGHVIHALDPTVVTAGPGQGYGLRKAANAVATHIELAASAEGASPQVVGHSKHIATAARNTVARSEHLVALAQKIQAATEAADAAALVSQMISLADQLIAGADANNDGRITWEQGEGGLQAADEHVKLMLATASR